MMKWIFGSVASVAMLLAVAAATRADDDSPPPVEARQPSQSAQPAAKEPTAADKLANKQEEVADSYARFKGALLKLAEDTRAADPARAELLEKAARQISASGTDDQLRAIGNLLDSELVRDLDQAIDKQDQVESDLNALLKLLLSENRDHRNASERERLRGYIKDVDQAIKAQKGIQGQTERSDDRQGLAERQAHLAGRTEEIANKIKANEERPDEKGHPKNVENPLRPNSMGPKDNDKDKKPGHSKPPGQKEKSDDKPGNEGKPDRKSGGEPGQDTKPGGKPGPSQNQPMGQSGPPSPDGAESQDDQANGRRQVQKAAERMRQAQQQLEQANRKGAAKEQEQAIVLLEKAKAELEEILRQLREEEVEKSLVVLEARFRNMLKLQQSILDATVLLDKKPPAQRDRADEIEANRLARREQEVVAEVDKVMVLLREDGSAVAFPAAVEQLREDMELIVERLNQAKIGSPTQRIEQDVIDALKEMIAALEKAQKDLQQRRSMPTAPGQPADPPLVDTISELKMIRALQMRVNRRTKQYEELVRSGESTEADMLPRKRKLAVDQQEIHRITRDLHLGRNE